MRSVLVTVGPLDWPAVFPIAALLVVIFLGWRRLEKALGEEPVPVRGIGYAVVAALVAGLSVLILLLINQYGPLKVRAYGVMLLLAFTTGALYIYRFGKPGGLTPLLVVDMVFLQLVLSIVGARLLYVILDLKDYAAHPDTVVDVWRGGLSFHGGLAGGILATVLFSRWRKVRLSVLMDLGAIALAIGYAITRIGCFLNGCCHGHATNLPWGVVFPENPGPPVPVHPTQLYASAGSLLLAYVLHRLRPHMHRPGQIFALYLVLYSVLRFGCEQTRRGATANPFALLPALTQGQAACIAIAIIGLVWFLLLQRMPYENPVTALLVQPTEQRAEPPQTAPEKKRRKRRADKNAS